MLVGLLKGRKNGWIQISVVDWPVSSYLISTTFHNTPSRSLHAVLCSVEETTRYLLTVLGYRVERKAMHIYARVLPLEDKTLEQKASLGF